MKKTLLLALIFIGFVSEAQIKRYSFKVAANYPLIKDVTTSDDLNLTPPWYMGTSGSGFTQYTVKATIRQSFEEHMGFDASGTIDYAFSKKFFFTSGLTASYIRYKQIISVESLGNNQVATNLPVTGGIAGSPYGTIYGNITFQDPEGNTISQPASLLNQSDKLGETTTLYLQVPVLAGVSLLKDKLLLRAGATFSFLLNASVYKTEASFDGTTIKINDVKDHTRDGYSELLASATIHATYLVTKRIGIDFTANKYLSPIYSNTEQDKKARYNVLSLGMSYNLSR